MSVFKLWAKLAKLHKHSEHVRGRIDLLSDIFICASSLCCCILMENALMQKEGAKCSFCSSNIEKYTEVLVLQKNCHILFTCCSTLTSHERTFDWINLCLRNKWMCFHNNSATSLWIISSSKITLPNVNLITNSVSSKLIESCVLSIANARGIRAARGLVSNCVMGMWLSSCAALVVTQTIHHL